MLSNPAEIFKVILEVWKGDREAISASLPMASIEKFLLEMHPFSFVEFPYEMRDVQRRMVEDIHRVLEQRGHIIFEAPTGTGKTIAALYPAAKYAMKEGKKIIYLVRTHSQEQQVIKEARKLGIFAIALQGRNNLCPLARENEELRDGNAEELSLLCRKMKREVIEKGTPACPYYYNLLQRPEALKSYIEEVHTAEEIFLRGVEEKICPYEALKMHLKDALLVVSPYIYFLHPVIRRSLLDRMGAPLEEIILIVDEAHNFPEFARELRSIELSVTSLERMEEEAQKYGNPLAAGYPITDIGEYLKEAIYSLRKYVADEDGILPEYALEEELVRIMELNYMDIEKLAQELISYGEMVREDRARRRKLPRSYIYHTGVFLSFWKESYSYEYVKLIKWGDNPSLEVYCMDPSGLTDIVRNVHSSVHMSGTLMPEEYRDLVDLPEGSMLRKYPSPFPKENLQIFYVDDVTTRYGEVDKYVDKIAEYVDKILGIGRNTAVFFPSYTLLARVREYIKSDVLVEEREMRTSTIFHLIEKFRKHGGAIFSVFGGRFSEGLDFPGEQLEIVVIVGIPYPKPIAKIKAMERYYDAKYGRGWDYVFHYPAMMKMKQAIGRLIRSPPDRGVAIILDRRASQFKREMPMLKSENIVKDVLKFFMKEKGEEGRHREM